MKIAVLAGGNSPERAVSLDSGRCVMQALIQKGHLATILDPACPPVGTLRLENADLSLTYPTVMAGYGYLAPSVLSLLSQADVVFSVLHGGAGEDGTISAILDSLGIPYCGSCAHGCFRAFDKAISAPFFQSVGIPIPQRYPSDALRFPCVAKPRYGGSSIGVSILQSETDTVCAKEEMLYESYITGREFSVGILEDRALPPVEILPARLFYDYESKYQSDATREICPAPLSKAQTQVLCDLAERAHRVLGLCHYSRIDFLQDEDGNFFCLEANALPGMTARSILPLCAAAAGLDFPSLCEKIAVLGAEAVR